MEVRREQRLPYESESDYARRLNKRQLSIDKRCKKKFLEYLMTNMDNISTFKDALKFYERKIERMGKKVAYNKHRTTFKLVDKDANLVHVPRTPRTG